MCAAQKSSEDEEDSSSEGFDDLLGSPKPKVGRLSDSAAEVSLARQREYAV